MFGKLIGDGEPDTGMLVELVGPVGKPDGVTVVPVELVGPVGDAEGETEPLVVFVL